MKRSPDINILLVEDEAFIAMMEVQQLEERGYTVIHAISGEEAIAQVNDKINNINLVLMDIDLGDGIDGAETARIILQDHDIPVVFLSSHTEKDVVEKTEEITSYGYVVKDTGITVLDASIKMALKLFEAKLKEIEITSALQASEERFDQLAEQSRIVIWEIDAGGIYTYVSHVASQVFGYRPDELVGKKHYYDLRPETGRAAFKASTSEFIKEKQPFANLENPVRRGDGSILWVSTNGMPLLHADGTLRGYHGSDTDITERKKAGEIIRASEHRFRAAFMTGLDAMYVATLEEGLIIEVNDEFKNVFGYPREEVIGKTSLGLNLYYNPADRKKMVAELKKKGRIKDLELKGLTKDREIITISISISIIELDEKKHILGVIRDITEQTG